MEKGKKIWQSSSGGLHPLVEAFTVGDDYRLDGEVLLPYDVKASKAHAQMLHSIGVLTQEELDVLLGALGEILTKWQEGEFKVLPEHEDGHTAIEEYITLKYGDVGKKIHTGRSRNDQSLVMLRLYMKDKLSELTSGVQQLASLFENKGTEASDVLMPGYTHMQKAMPTTVGLWLGSFACALRDATIAMEAATRQIDQNPLGSAAGFGISHLQLNRQMTTEALGFERLQANSLYCGFSRGYFENIVLQALSQCMIVMSRFAVDMMMFTQQETAFFSLPDEFVTGSSIMPQKKNYDLFEIMRANGRVYGSLQQQVQQIVTGLGSGYHRDLQVTKKAFIEGVSLCSQSIELMHQIVPALRIHQERLRSAMTRELYVTDEVYKHVANGMAFREAYQKVKAEFFAHTTANAKASASDNGAAATH